MATIMTLPEGTLVTTIITEEDNVTTIIPPTGKVYPIKTMTIGIPTNNDAYLHVPLIINNQTNHYCWMHGKGGHPSSQCHTPYPNHQWRTTFSNCMNRNPEGC